MVAQPLRVLQWNCRGLPKKKGELTAWLHTQDRTPDIIALQEPGKTPNIRGYVTHQYDPNLAMLTSKQLLAHITHHDEHVLTLQIGPPKQMLIITNIYSPPKHQLQDMSSHLLPVGSPHTHVLLGDFNAPHTSWGYIRDTKKGALLVKHTTANQYVLHNDLHEPTRHGNSVERDTSPDLTFSTAGLHIRWYNTQEHLGSDHNMILIDIDFAPPRIKWRRQQLTDWDKVRATRSQVSAKDITEWTDQLKRAWKKFTQYPVQYEGEPAADKHLLHCWQARHSLTKRWKRNKTNRSLRIRINKLNNYIHQYTSKLLAQQWSDLCDSFQGTLSMRRHGSYLDTCSIQQFPREWEFRKFPNW